MPDLSPECLIDFDSWKDEINRFVEQVTAELNQVFEQVDGASDLLTMHHRNLLADPSPPETTPTQLDQLAATEKAFEPEGLPARPVQPDPSAPNAPPTPPSGPRAPSNTPRELPEHRLASLRERLSQLKSSDEMFADNLNQDRDNPSPADGEP